MVTLENLSQVFDAFQDDELNAIEYENALKAIRDSDNSDDTERKQAALMLEIDSSEIPDQASYDDNVFTLGGDDYRVLTDDEADEACKAYIKDSLWSFSADFLSGETGIDDTVFKALADKCEGANDAVESIIKGTCGIDDFVESAIGADGRGHFLNHEDGDELENGDYFIYRA